MAHLQLVAALQSMMSHLLHTLLVNLASMVDTLTSLALEHQPETQLILLTPIKTMHMELTGPVVPLGLGHLLTTTRLQGQDMPPIDEILSNRCLSFNKLNNIVRATVDLLSAALSSLLIITSGQLAQQE